MNILITGGTGFIGSNLALYLLEQRKADKIVLFDSYLNIARLGQYADEVTFVQGDTSNGLLFADTVQEHKIDYIVHLAALLRAPPYQMAQTNAAGTMNVLEVARLQGVKRVIFASSNGIYPVRVCMNEADLADEDLWPTPNSVYGACKQFVEITAETYMKNYGLEVLSLRFPGVFGPGRLSRRRVGSGHWLDAPGMALQGHLVVLPPDNQIIDWIYSSDLSEALFLGLTVKNPPRWVYNLNSRYFRSSEWTAAIRKALPAAKITISKEPIILSQIFKADRFKNNFGFRPRFSVEEGINDYLAMVKSQKAMP